jgi:hypothetical protein
MSRLLFTMRQVIFSGSFFDSGVKKFATALPAFVLVISAASVFLLNVLVVVDDCFRFVGGGDTPRSFELALFPKPGRVTIFNRFCDNQLFEWVLRVFIALMRGQTKLDEVVAGACLERETRLRESTCLNFDLQSPLTTFMQST